MRTRRSPRNQEILYRALGGPAVQHPRPAVRPIEYTPEQLERQRLEWDEAVKDLDRRKARAARAAANKLREAP